MTGALRTVAEAVFDGPKENFLSKKKLRKNNFDKSHREIDFERISGAGMLSNRHREIALGLKIPRLAQKHQFQSDFGKNLQRGDQRKISPKISKCRKKIYPNYLEAIFS